MVKTGTILSNENKITGLDVDTTDDITKHEGSDVVDPNDLACATVLLLYLILILIILAVVLFISPTVAVLSAVCVYNGHHGIINTWCPGLISSVTILVIGSMNVCLLGCILWWSAKEWYFGSLSDGKFRRSSSIPIEQNGK